MPVNKCFKGFFSYAHHDAETDPALIAAFTTELENRVTAKLVNARFEVWRDEERIRTGEFWKPGIEAQLLQSATLIVMLSPRWIESDFCRREYTFVEEKVEAAREVGAYIVPLLVRAIKHQESTSRPSSEPSMSAFSTANTRTLMLLISLV